MSRQMGGMIVPAVSFYFHLERTRHRGGQDKVHARRDKKKVHDQQKQLLDSLTTSWTKNNQLIHSLQNS